MANSIAYVLSKNTYPDAFQANLIGVNQGTQIVYATTSTLTNANVLFADSKLTQPIYGDGTSWHGVQLLTNTAVVYPITISESGVIAIGSGTTTTTAAPTTTTTAAPTTTTTTIGVSEESGFAAFSPGVVCAGGGTGITVYYSGSLGIGTALYLDAGLTNSYQVGVNGGYLRLYFAAEYNQCIISGPAQNEIFAYTPCP